MPQIQPGQVTPGAQGAPKLYGVDKVENTLPFQERLFRLFKPQEFVTIKNITTEPVYWQYMPPENETETFSEDGTQRQIYRKSPEMWMIAPGETEVLVGASAYRALDVMYKSWAATKTLKTFSDPTAPQFNEKNEHLPKNFNFADGGAQEDFIKRAYVGKAMPSFQPLQDTAAEPVPAAPELPQPQVPLTQDNQPETAPVAAQAPVTGAPLVPPTYATGDVDAKTVAAAKELSGAGSA